MTQTFGDDVRAIIRGLDAGIDTEITSQHLARSAGRALEEMVELCLACGMTAGEVLGRAADALHNEARKAGCYPTEIETSARTEELVAELADVMVSVDYVRVVVEATPREVLAAGRAKVERMRGWAENGEAHVVNGCFYRKVQKA